MTEGPQRTTHTLGEILLDHRTTEEKVKEAAKGAPFWVIAIMGHAILAFILGMVVLRHEMTKEPTEAIQGELKSDAADLKIEEKPEPPKEIERTAIPQVENTDVTEVQEEFSTATDDVVNPYATENAKFGVSEGQDDAPDNLLTMSSGGKGLAGAIGLGSGSGAGGGARRGSPLGGSRIGRRNSQAGALQQTEKVVMAGLEWLRRHQSPDGSWDCDAFSTNCDAKRGAACTGRGSAVFDAGVSGLALLAFLGAGYDSQRPGPYLDTVRNGLKYLKQIQDAQGCYGPTGDNRHTYAHACATIAMCEAFASTKQLPWRKSAEQGVAYINACQNPYKAWRYGKQPGDNDSSVTGWMLMALKSAKDSGIPINERTMKDGLAFIDSVTDEDTGRTGYTKKGEQPVRPEGLQSKFPATESEALTAVAMCSRIFCDAADTPLMKAGGELLSKKLPIWDEAKGSIDMYYWYYGTLAMFQMGGEHWERWNKNLKNVVIDNQLKEGCTEGSWDPKDPWGEEGGRVYSTALMTLCLEVYYRYPKVFGAKK
jgi:hypothetical protein